ncbi:hypothetical protein ACA30_07955 [Virgibacillus soli]|uniref:Uncharacterized protein n=1 Tax=Lederbergia galactosidilytica TaxID=217031 RepID=A0A0Q9XSN1_9BACI|nr:hypothetical protein ACA29_18190 [Lederbergia galactosidilytica]KRG15103.1 hypothetical protein ACA30_07955 [Virgibacillus soli]OAK67931.1 hypothetical protein ABB05_18000 [Lederbergia galactosidilytica]
MSIQKTVWLVGADGMTWRKCDLQVLTSVIRFEDNALFEVLDYTAFTPAKTVSCSGNQQFQKIKVSLYSYKWICNMKWTQII